MIKTIIKKGSYHDSVVLMLLTNQISNMPGVNKISIMMATPANKILYKASGLYTDALEDASANDMAIVADVEKDSVIDQMEKEIELFFQAQDKKRDTNDAIVVKSWEKAKEKRINPNLAVISVAGTYAAIEAERALDEGLNVFIFSDNVTVEDELKLKQKAHKKGLIVMGPDCGTSIINGVPIAFTNNVRKGNIGIVGASGTGIQELITIIDRMGSGVSNAIGTGGRDLSEEIGGITMLDLIDLMEDDHETSVLVVISKPPAKEVKNKLLERLSICKKPVVTLFLGEKPECHEENFYHAYTLDEAARIAVSIVKDEEMETLVGTDLDASQFQALQGKTIKGYYSGGTLGNEAAMLMKEALDIHSGSKKIDGYMLQEDGHIIVDLGDDVYTQGKPHPMIDPTKRIECMKEAMSDESTGVILFDVVLGYGSHDNMAEALSPTIKEISELAARTSREIMFVATVCGTKSDFQGYDKAVQILQDAGVIVCESNKIAVCTALQIIGYTIQEEKKQIIKRENIGSNKQHILFSQSNLLCGKPNIINIGLESFGAVAQEFGCNVVNLQWAPPANGNMEMLKALTYIRNYEGVNVDEANQLVLTKIKISQPVIVDVTLAKNVIEQLNCGKVILHAGTSIKYENMPDPMQGSCVGAVLFEKWAHNEADARTLLESGEIQFISCHQVNAVGPMGGITTGNMPVFVVKNMENQKEAYCTMNEGIGKVLRFGSYSEEVVNRLTWMKEVLGPTLGSAIRSMENGLMVNPMIAKAIAMGDEFHQRNIAASMLFVKEVTPIIAKMDISNEDKYQVIKFLSDTDQFFLNIMMATGKVVMDSAREIQEGTVVTAMCRNGVDFSIRISGMGETWFTGPVNTPQGLYFTGYDGKDACADMGDSAITEAFGVGGMAMIAAPAVTRFVGAGGYQDALNISNEMTEITIEHNPNFVIPTWDFKGCCLGIDARLVVEKGITPIINTGIAHKKAGYGQIGAGTVRPPMECFEKAIMAYAKKLGFC